MTVRAPNRPHDAVRLAPESVEAIARRVAELVSERERPRGPRRLLTAAEVSHWWGVERAWVYANADRLGARRLGTGQRPRLRFDPDEVARRSGSGHLTDLRVAVGRMVADRRGFSSTPLTGERELWSSRNQEVAGRRSNAPGPAPKGRPPARQPA